MRIGETERRNISARKRKLVTISANRRSRIDPNNVRALTFCRSNYELPVSFGGSVDPKGD